MSISTIFFFSIILSFQILLMVSCRKDQLKEIPTLLISDVTDITTSSFTVVSDVVSDGGSPITARGVCWSATNETPTISDNKTLDGLGLGIFASTINGLMSGTAYYLRAYATNSVGTAYFNHASIKTLVLFPAIKTTDILSITSNSFISGGEIINDGGSPITARGVCWYTSEDPTVMHYKTTDGAGTGSFTSFISGLSPDVKYYVRAYFQNGYGTFYGNQLTAKTTAPLATIDFLNISSITATKASCFGIISDEGGTPITDNGVCWSTNENPTIVDNKTQAGSGAGSIRCTISGLTPDMIHHVRAYATNSGGTVYGNQVTIKTMPPFPTIETKHFSLKTTTTALSGGYIKDDGGSPISVRGVCWSTNNNPTIDDNKTSDGAETGDFTSSISDLTPNTVYYLRAYATNNTGTAYGSIETFKTFAGIVTDIDGNVYNTITIGTQVWMVENLNTTKYRNGDYIQKPTEDNPWKDIITGAQTSNPGTGDKYGKLYNWYAVHDNRNIAPLGWHVPTDAEWTTLTDNVAAILGNSDHIGSALGSNIPGDWGSSPVANSDPKTNSTSFAALPGGGCDPDGYCGGNWYYGLWWTSTGKNPESAWLRSM